MKRLWLLRHAKSSWDDDALADADRPLARRGETAAAAMGQYLATSDVRPELVLCSPARRARQTLGLVLPDLGDRLEIRIEPLLYTFDAEVLVSTLRTVDDDIASLLIVGHNPACQELALWLTAGGERRADLEAKLPTGALVAIDIPARSWSEVRAGEGTVVGFVTPRSLEAR